ncbi:hypothetical protein EZV62_003406 [Acer yangbiense]|uniref:DUF4220 domain-containing protein n=1 Tax=Acer yangbiense TaxID=1000413 RepID=A0A5C7IH50_9ROSI|nr:hypothetical protein EZV62_003406 [Acer yangbiense]
MEIFPETLKKLWNLWEIRSLLLLSLSLQIILIVFGSRRKINNSHSWIVILLNVIVWCAYISADWVATVALSVMASNEADCGQVSSKATDSLQAFWAPFLLLHLGGPDTITAYSLEDNELWLRHLLGLIVEVGVAFYVFLRFWSSNVLTLLSIPVFITGIVKYGERTWVLWSSSSERFKDSLGSFKDSSGSSSDPDPCFDFFIKEAYSDFLLYYNYEIINEKSAEDAFKLVAIELGRIYDVLYTKAAIVYSLIGISLRCISFVSSVSALVLFSIFIDKHSYSLIDITVTYLLLSGAVLLEIYASMENVDISLQERIFKYLQNIAYELPQKEVDSFCQLRDERLSNKGEYALKHYGFGDLLVDYMLYLMLFHPSMLPKGIGEIRYDHTYVDVEGAYKVPPSKHGHRAKKGITSNNCHFSLFKQAKNCHSLLVEQAQGLFNQAQVEQAQGLFKQARGLLKQAQGEHVLEQAEDLFEQARGLFKQTFDLLKQTRGEQAHGMLKQAKGLFKQAQDRFKQAQGEQAQGLFELAQGLDSHFRDLEKGGKIRWDMIRWEMISEVWLEMLAYAAQNCDWKEHAKHLRNGGELLTHVSVLMVNFRLNKLVM